MPVSQAEGNERGSLPNQGYFPMREFEFVGFATMNDPVRQNVVETVQRFIDAKMQVVMLTGDDRIPALESAVDTKIIVDEKKEFFRLQKENPHLSKD